eukprot:scaffold117179_cov28-Tisochrysis_lutea.AAC.1
MPIAQTFLHPPNAPLAAPGGDSGIFSGPDRTWVNRCAAAAEAARAIADEAAATAAGAEATNGDPRQYGVQVRGAAHAEGRPGCRDAPADQACQ